MTAASRAGKRTNRAEAKGEKQKGKTSPWEWAVAALGALLIVSALGYMTYYGLTHPSTPPDITVEARSVSPVSAGFLVEFEARNHGNSTAAGLVITGELRSGDVVVESSEVTLDYLPEQSRRRAGLFFQNDPREHNLQIRAAGFAEP